jgi:RNA polymerase sigma-70 factor (ECF subfamily)
MTEAEIALVRSAQGGDRAAFEELVRRTSRLVYARLFLETGDRHRSEDLLQETLLTAFKSLRGLTEPASFRSWLLTIAQNTAIDAARREHRLKRNAGALAGSENLKLVAGEGPRPAEQAERNETRQQVLSILRSMPEEYRLPLTLRYLSGADYETIQTQLGLTNGSLRGLLHRGLRMLRGKMVEAFGEEIEETGHG